MLRKIWCVSIICVCINFILCVSDGISWRPRQFNSKHLNREELVITEVFSDESFSFKYDVICWKSISMGTRSYAIGLMVNKIAVVIAERAPNNDTFVINVRINDFNDTFTVMELFENWNKVSMKPEIVLVASSSGPRVPELLWFKVNGGELEHFWTWHVHKDVSHVRYFKLDDDRHRLLLLNNAQQNSSANFYEFVLNPTDRDFWLLQTIPLPSFANTAALNTYGSKVYLSIPQNEQNEVLVYKLENDRFKLFDSISGRNVTYVTSFKVGFKSFLVLNGEDAGIYKFTNDEVVWEQIEGFHWENVNFWFPISAKTYRDDVLLILQRSLHHGTHRSFFLEAVVYDGNQFVQHEEIPCSFYGEVEHGLECIVEEDTGGLAGAAVLSLGSILGIVVPRKGKSELFMVRTKMKRLKSPMEIEFGELMETREKLQKLMDEQKSKIEAIKIEPIIVEDPSATTVPWNDSKLLSAALQSNFTTTTIPILQNERLEKIDVEELIKKIAEVRTEIDKVKSRLSSGVRLNKLVIDGEIHALRESYVKTVIADKLNDEPVPEVFNDLVRKNDVKYIRGHKTFENLRVKNLIFETIDVTIDGDLVFQKPFEVSGDVTADGINDVNLADEIVQSTKKYDDQLDFEHVIVQSSNLPSSRLNVEDSSDIDFSSIDELEIETFNFPGNIVVENINGENFEAFKKGLCLTNANTRVPGTTTIAGNLIVQDAEANFLNGLRFPDEYVLRSSDFSRISGDKTFDGPITAETLTVPGTVNGIDTERIMTLSTDQTFPGDYIFNDLEVTESLNVDGEINGANLDAFLPNPSLTESNEIKAKVNFVALEVAGAVTVSGKFNGVNLEEMLGDVIYMDEEEATLDCNKSFPVGFSVINGLNIGSNSINSVPLDLFVDKNSEQTLVLKTLNGDVSFENLQLDGLYDGVNITQLNQEAVKLTGEHFISATLNFDNGDENLIDLAAINLEITETLNGLSPDKYYFTTGDSRNITNALNFENIRAERVIVEGNLSGTIKDFSLEEFDARRFSLTKDQLVTAKFTVKNLDTENVIAEFINGEPFEKFFDYQYHAKKISEKLFNGELSIKNLFVNGSLDIDYVDGEDVKRLLDSFVWPNRDNHIKNATLQGDVHVKNLYVKNFNGVEFDDFHNNIMYKSDTNPIINGFKIFVNGFHVRKMLDAERLNDIYVDDILTKTGPQQLEGPVHIYGDVFVQGDTEIYGDLNEVPIEYVSKTYEFIGDTCVIKDDLVLDRLVYINNLIVDGCVNEINLTEFLENMVYKSSHVKLPGMTVFENIVHVEKNLIVKDTINDVDFSEFAQDVVYVTEDEMIEGNVIFTQRVCVEEELIVDSNLNSRYLMGIDLDNWNNNAVFINRGKIQGKLTFETVTIQGDVFLNYSNNVDLNGLIPLRTDQYINENLEFLELSTFHDIVVDGRVNGYRLQDEYQNTILMHEFLQEINSNIVFHGNVLVRDGINFFDLVNGKNLSNVVTTGTDQNLTGRYVFDDEVVIESDLILNGKINEIDVNEWARDGLKTSQENAQIIFGDWVVDGNVSLLEDETGGEGNIEGIDLRNIVGDLEEKRSSMYSTETELTEDYADLCKDVNAIIDVAKNQIYVFKYLENMQKFEYSNEIENVHTFKVQNRNYMLVSENRSCVSHLFIWDYRQFEAIGQIETGSVSQFVSVYDGDLVFLVSRSDKILSDCAVHGTNVWKFTADELIHLYKLEDHELLQDSLAPGTFYGLRDRSVVEYKLETIVETNVKIKRKWVVDNDNLRFVPRGLGTGLALSDGDKLFKLAREDLIIENDFGYETEAFVRGSVTEEINSFLPGYYDGEVVVVNVGIEGNRRSLVTIASHEETSVIGKLDFIKVYENALTGKLFHKIPTYKPTSLISVEFDNDETLLTFLEDETVLQIYEYKGIEGFKHRASVKLNASKLIFTPLSFENRNVFVMGAIYKNKLNLLQAVMEGNRLVADKVLCEV